LLSYTTAANCVLGSGIETGGSSGSMNWGHKLLGAPESGAKKIYARKKYANSEKLKN